jgi:hypothetical protein
MSNFDEENWDEYSLSFNELVDQIDLKQESNIFYNEIPTTKLMWDYLDEVK